jgi:hypothetical protein
MTIGVIEQKYQKLFDYLFQEVGWSPLTSDMDEIVSIVKEISTNRELPSDEEREMNWKIAILPLCVIGLVYIFREPDETILHGGGE